MLCLASALTVLGSFSADNYKNSLMSLKINSGSNGYVSLTAYTKNTFSGNIRTERVDEDTYNIILPETYGDNVQIPDLTQYENIESMQVSTYPYTPDTKGYTSIRVRTYGNPSLNAKTSLYLEDKSGQNYSSNTMSDYNYDQPSSSTQKQQTSYWSSYEMNQNKTASTVPKTGLEPNKTNNYFSTTKPQTKQTTQPVTTQKTVTSSSKTKKIEEPSGSKEPLFITIAICIVTMLVLFIYYISKDKMASVVGEQLKFDDDKEEKKDEKKSKRKKITRAINKLDSIYTNQTPSSVNSVAMFAADEKKEEQEINNNEKNEAQEEESVVIDLDTLYNEKVERDSKTAEENLKDTVNNNENDEAQEDDLSEFLDSFTFDEEIQNESVKEAEEKEPFDNELYEKTINNENLVFTQSDDKKLSQLIQNEISDDTLDNINEFLPEEDLKPKPLTQEEILENLLAEYTIKQDISFSKADVDALKSIMSVELDKSFITDLRTNSENTIKMYNELQQKSKKPHKTSELLTLNVKDLLPDLSKELKKQGNKRIESNAKPEVVYFSEGYEVSKFSVNSELSNIAKALQSKEATKFRPSDEVPIAESGYDVQTLEIKEDLPDFADVKAHPEKYEKPKEKVVVDENALLQSISNVKFRPFYEDVQDELNKFEGFEIVNNFDEEEEYDDLLKANNTDEKNYLDLDNVHSVKPRIKPKQTQKVKDDAQKLLELIEEKQQERKEKKELELKKQAEKEKDLPQTKTEKTETKPALKKEVKTVEAKISDKNDGNIIKSVQCNDKFSCCLVKDDEGYSVVGKMDDKSYILKHYDNLRTENIQARENEKLSDGNLSYIIRVSIHKFIVKVTQNGMEFVMDLC